MKGFSYSVLLLLFATVNATFWNNNDGFQQVMDPYRNNLSHEYLRALSVFKRKMQLLGFYPLVLDDDGLEYISMDPYLLQDDDDDDEMYKLLKKVRKERKKQKKSQKKKLKKSKKKDTTEPPPVETTTVQPISNIVYYWPSTITTFVHTGQGNGVSTYEHSIDTRVSIENSSEENSSEVDSSSKDRSKEQPPAKVNYQTTFTFGRKLDDDNVETRATQNQTSSTTTTTTPYPLLTVFPDPEQVAIQEIIDQQEIVNKITDNDQKNATKTVDGTDDVDRTTDASVSVQDNFTTDGTVHVTDDVQVYQEIPSYSQGTKDVGKIPEENLPTESTTVTAEVSCVTSVDVATESSVYATEPIPSIPTGVLQFFHETLPEEHNSPDGLPNLSEIFGSNPVSNYTDINVPDKFEETTENDTNTDGHRETDTHHSYSVVPLNEETTTSQPPPVEHSTTPKSIDGTNYTNLEITIPTNVDATSDSEGHEYLIDPKTAPPIRVADVLGGLESRSLTGEPVVVVVVDDKSGRQRSDIPIEADDIDKEDTTDNLAYNLIESKLEAAKVVENTSAEVSTPPPAVVETSNHDNFDQFDGEIIPLIPIIIKQMKQGNVNPEEMEIMKNSFGPFWPYIVEEASRESDSSEEMNPLLSELLNSANVPKIVKREATYGRRRLVYGSRPIYYDDDDDGVEYVRRRGYYGRRRRPYIKIYQKK